MWYHETTREEERHVTVTDTSTLMAEDSAEPVIDIAWIVSENQVEEMLLQIEESVNVAFDLETTGLREHAPKFPSKDELRPQIAMLTITLDMGEGMELRNFVVPLAHPESPFQGTWRALLRRIMETARTKPLIGHNVKFDARWVYATTGLDLTSAIAWDTRISGHLLDETVSNRLEARSERLFGVEQWGAEIDFEKHTSHDYPIYTLGEYAARDTYWTMRLFFHDREMLWLTGEGEPEVPEDVVNARLGRLASWVSMPTTASLTKLEQRGIVLDVEWVEDTIRKSETKLSETMEQIGARYEDEELDPEKISIAPTSLWFRKWTELAVEAGDLEIAAMTKAGKPQWTKQVLGRQAGQGSEAASLVLEARFHAKRLEYLRSWLTSVTERGTIHANYNAGSVVTGRLSSDSPNMQQINYALRQAFVPRPGMVMVDIDYSQIELRVAAHVSKCEPMVAAFQRGDDLHTLLGQRILQTRENHRAREEDREPVEISFEDVTPEDRQAAKSANFGLLYGMGAMGFQLYAQDAYGVSLTAQEASEIYDTFFDTWKGMKDWHWSKAAEVQLKGYVTSPVGRVRRLPGIWDANPKMVSFAERAAVNAPVQGFASDLMQLSLASIQGMVPGYAAVEGAYPVATVHDSVVIEVEESRWEEVTRECLRRMTDLDDVLSKLDCQLTVPLAAEASIGTRWGLADIGELTSEEV